MSYETLLLLYGIGVVLMFIFAAWLVNGDPRYNNTHDITIILACLYMAVLWVIILPLVVFDVTRRYLANRAR